MKRATLAILTLLLVGCTTHGRIGAMSEVPPNAAWIVVIRPSGFVGCGISLVVTVDGQEAYGLACGEHVVLIVPAGEHIFGVKHRTWFVADESTSAMTAAAGQRYYLRLAVQNPVGGRPELDRITEQAARHLMAKTSLVK